MRHRCSGRFSMFRSVRTGNAAVCRRIYYRMSDVELLARLIQCEAGGEGETGMRAVATVIVNRLRIPYGEYGEYGSLRDVVTAPYQFECYLNAARGKRALLFENVRLRKPVFITGSGVDVSPLHTRARQNRGERAVRALRVAGEEHAVQPFDPFAQKIC